MKMDEDEEVIWSDPLNMILTYRRKYDEASIQYGERLAKTTIGTSGIMRTPSSF
jgi:hypothetical protein